MCLLACSAGTYKWAAGNSSCVACPRHSESVDVGSVECRCVSGYYRSPDDDKSTNCTRQWILPQFFTCFPTIPPPVGKFSKKLFLSENFRLRNAKSGAENFYFRVM